VWAADRIVAVVAEHHASEGTGRLTARRIDRAYEQLSASDLDQLAELLGLPATLRGLPDVVPAERGQLVRSAYLAQVRENIAPDVLIGREKDLAAWAEFCAGTDPYAWWQAQAWAGKSALASWFVTHPPAGVDVVSFFITGRLSGQADSDQFLTDMIEQLDAFDPAGQGSPAVVGARAGVWLDRLAAAAAQAEERGRRLVIVVDGLDEDEAGMTPRRGRPSIVSLLPRRPPPGVRIIVTSRLDRDLPSDVPSGHPLRACIRHNLPVSPVAQDLEERAKQELQDLLGGDQIAVDVVGYIAGSGGGLTKDDLSALAGLPPYKLDPILGSVSGRSLEMRASTDPRYPQANPATRVYLFAHETLRVIAEEQLGADLARYREKVHEWIGSYAGGGWPDTTPGYAIRGYLRLLAATTDATRLSALARDSRRRAFLLKATASDYASLTEIGIAQSLIADQNVLDLKALAELAAYRLAILIRNQTIPDDLPIMWARLARFDHAEALARTITGPEDKARALTRLSAIAVRAGDLDRANRLTADAEIFARIITDLGDQGRALTRLVTAIAQAGDLDRAEVLARTINQPWAQADALTSVATAIAQAGDLDRAEALARTITRADNPAHALAGLATIAARAGDLDRASRLTADAEALARTITEPMSPAPALTDVATAIAQAGDLDRAEALARTIDWDLGRARALTGLATIAAHAGDLDRASRLTADAEALARTITDWDQARALGELAAAAAQAGDLDRANRLAADAEALARTVSPYDQAQVIADMSIAIAQAGDLDRAGDLARTITDPDDQAQALTSLATIAAQAGDLDRAEALARTITGPYNQARALTGVATIAGDLDRANQLAADAEALARTISPDDQARWLAGLATIAAEAGDLDQAYRLAADGLALAPTISPDAQAEVLAGAATLAAQAGDLDEAEALARAITGPDDQVRALTGLATIAAQAGDLGEAYRLATGALTLARTISPDAQAQVIADVAIAIAQAGDLDHAEEFARAITIPGRQQAQALTGLATAAAQAGDLDRAENFARTVTGAYPQARVIAGAAIAIAQAGDLDRANRLAADAEDRARRSADAKDLDEFMAPHARAEVLADVATAFAQAGDLDRAEAVARTITDDLWYQAKALASVAIIAAQAGDLDRAEAFARTITDPETRGRALTGVATAIAQAGDLDRAAHLLAAVLVIDMLEISWIKAVSQFFPSATGDLWSIFADVLTTSA
jgi:hypothetical protein